MPQLFQNAADGGYMYSDQLSDEMRTQLKSMVRFRNFCDTKDAVGLHNGDTFRWNVYSKVQTQGGTIAETATMPSTQFTIRQESLTITEYGNSVPFTKKLRDLAKHDVVDVVEHVLLDDARTTLDAAAHAQFNATPLFFCPVGGTDVARVQLDVGAPSQINNVPLHKAHIRDIASQMSERDIIPYEGENYCAIGRPQTFVQLEDDLEAISQYVEAGFNRISNGECGRYAGVRFFKQTSIPSEAWANGQSDAVFFMGRDTVCEAVAEPEHIRGKIPNDFGRDHAIAWYALLGFGICHTAQENARIIKWATA